MIQRIQSLYLLLADLLLLALFFLPFASLTTIKGDVYQLNLMECIKVGNPPVIIQKNWFLVGLVMLAILSITATIFLYKDRPKQLKITLLSLIILISANLLVYYLAWNGKIISGEKFTTHVVAVFPLVAVILLLLAFQGIKKDENLVKSIDRIR